MILLYKPLGLTPLDCIRQYQTEHPEFAHEKMGYAGRLDPMAEGLLLVMVGSENKNREHYLNLDKEYEVEMLLGISTDTYDLLGLITETANYSLIERSTLEEVFAECVGDIIQKYPPFSLKTVNGKPLYAWAREGKTSDIDLPEATRTIYRIDYVSDRLIESQDLAHEIYLKLSTIQTGDFRTDQVSQSWNAYFSKTQQNPFYVVKFKVSCSSGTYMRSLVHAMGHSLHIPAVAYSIKRTRVGDHTLSSAEAIAHS